MKRLSAVLAGTAIVALSAGTALAADPLPVIPVAPPPLAAPPPAPAPAGGPYVSVFGGLLWVPPVVVEAVITPSPALVATDRGYRFGGAFGYNLNNTLGIEGEIAWGRVQLAGVAAVPPAGEDPIFQAFADDYNGYASILTLFGNVTIGHWFGNVRPYLALGAGAVNLKLDVPAGFGNGAQDKDWTWGAQLLAGVDFAIGERFSIGGRYRLQYVGATAFEDVDGDPITIDPFLNHGAEVVFTFRF